MPVREQPCANFAICGNSIRRNLTGLCRRCYDEQRYAAATVPVPAVPEQTLAVDREARRLKEDLSRYKALYNQALETIEQQDRVSGWLAAIREGMPSTFSITPKEGSGTSEATPVIVASDWHIEELVTLASTSGLNEFNPEIAENRIRQFWERSLRLVRLLNKDVTINTVVVALLGDFITNDIHDADSAENNAELPIKAILRAQDYIRKGIEFLLEHTTYNLVIPCKVGNHSRTTQKVRVAGEMGHSLETLMYVNLASLFEKEPRVTFIFDEGYHTYIDIYNQTVRFHHGHALKYGGGIGGLFIPAYKSISQWQKGKQADLDVMGHFHQTKDGGNFLCNGSLIGYNAFALRIRADFEPPKQTLFLMDKRRGRTATWPILLTDPK